LLPEVAFYCNLNYLILSPSVGIIAISMFFAPEESLGRSDVSCLFGFTSVHTQRGEPKNELHRSIW
jgi:hypothetical protein